MSNHPIFLRWCSECRHNGTRIHLSTIEHKRNTAKRNELRLGSARETGIKPAWRVSLDRWNEQYDE